jgi:flagellin
VSSYILNNSAALSALQSLNMTQQALATTQNQVSSGLSVANASDNAAYWSIATQLNSDSTITTAANSAISQSQAILDTATTSINQIITTIQSIQTALTAAINTGANYSSINATLAQSSGQLTDAVNGAYFNGVNVLDGSQTTGGNTAINFVSGYYATSTNQTTSSGGTQYGLDVTTVGLNLQTLYTPSSGSAGTGLLVATGTTATAGSYDLTQLGSSTGGGTTVSAANAQDILTSVSAALSNITNYAAQIGGAQDRLSTISNLNSALTTNYSNGVAGLVDADMNQASTRLQALQTQQQLGIQSLSIANQNAQLILKLFP